MKRCLLLAIVLLAVVVVVATRNGSPRATADQTSHASQPLVFPNGVNTLVQQDSFGDNQNVAYYDSDSGLFLGPGSDPRTTILANVPINLFRRHIVLDFEEAGLDPRCTFRQTASASGRAQMGVFTMATGATRGSVAELSLPNVSAPAYAGQRIYFYMRTPLAGHLQLSFGLQHPSRDNMHVSFSRGDVAGRGGAYVARTSNGAGHLSQREAQGEASKPDEVRRLFCINITKTESRAQRQTGEVEFYLGSDGGILERKAVLTDNIPDVTGEDGTTQHLVPFVRLENNDGVDQRLDVDVIYAVFLR